MSKPSINSTALTTATSNRSRRPTRRSSIKAATSKRSAPYVLAKSSLPHPRSADWPAPGFRSIEGSDFRLGMVGDQDQRSFLPSPGRQAGEEIHAEHIGRPDI